MKKIAFIGAAIVLSLGIVTPAFSQSFGFWKFYQGGIRPIVNTYRIDATAGLSGTTLHAQDRLTASGTTILEGNIIFASITSCTTALQTTSTGQVICGSPIASFGTGNVITVGDTRYVKKSGDTMTGDLIVRANISGSSLTINGENTSYILGRLGIGTSSPVTSAQLHLKGNDDVLRIEGSSLSGYVEFIEGNAPRGYIGYGNGSTFFTAGEINDGFAIMGSNALQFGANAKQIMTLSGSNVGIGTGNQRINAALEVVGTISGRILHAQDLIESSGALVIEGNILSHGNISGSTIAGVGLYACNNSNQKIVYNNTSKQFECSTDQDTNTTYSAGQGLKLNSTTFSLNSVISGSLVSFTTVSGAIVHAQSQLRSSGSAIIEGSILSHSNISGSTVSGMGLYSCNSANQKVVYNNTSNNFECAVDVDTNTTYQAGQGLALISGSFFRLNAILTGSYLNFQTVSGSIVHAQNQLRSSGSIIAEGNIISHSNLSGVTIAGGGLYDCDNGVNSKLLWDVSTRSFSCGTDQNTITTYQAGQGIALVGGSYFRINAILSGTLLRYQTVSGSVVHADNQIQSSGSIIAEGNILTHANLSGASISGGGLYACNGANQKIVYNNSTKQFECASDQNNQYGAGQGLSLIAGATFQLNSTLTGTSLEIFGTASGRTVSAQDLLTSSGALIVEGNATFDTSTLFVNSDKDLVGIGTKTPLFRLDISSGSTVTGMSQMRLINPVAFPSAGTEVGLEFQSAGASTAIDKTGRIYGKYDSAIYADARITIQSVQGGAYVDTLTSKNAKVGILTLNPDSALEVIGTSSGQSLAGAGGQFTLSGLGAAVFNEMSQAVDFRVESDGNANMLFLNGTTNRVGIGTATPDTTLEVIGSMSGRSLQITGTGARPLIYTNSSIANGGVVNIGSSVQSGVIAGVQSRLFISRPFGQFGMTIGGESGQQADIILNAGNGGLNQKRMQFVTNLGSTTIRSLTDANGLGFNFITMDHVLGNLGIGGTSTTTGFKLQSNGNISMVGNTFAIQNASAPAGRQVWQHLINNTDSTYNIGPRTDDTLSAGSLSIASFRISTSATTNSLVLSGSNVGIGRLFPKTKLEVAGTMSGSSLSVDGNAVWQNILTATATLDFPNSALTGCDDLTVTVGGAASGDTAFVAPPAASVGAESTFTAYVSASNTVTVKHCSHGLATDPASGTFRVTVIKY